MSDMEQKELMARMSAMTEEEQVAAVKCFKDSILLNEINRRLAQARVAQEKIRGIILNEQ